MAASEWGTKEWNNDHFPENQLDSTGDTWGMRWRGVEKIRHASYLSLIKDDLQDTRPLTVLDIGCALCDFTEKAWKLNRNNKFWGMDTSDNAIAWVTENFPMFSCKVGAIPDIPFDVQFDMVFCLEVLCFMNEDERKQTIENIHSVLAPSGKLLFSGILDGGRQHHTEDELIELLRNDFEIRQIIYNHRSLHDKLIDAPMSFFESASTGLLRVLEMSNEEFLEWRSSKAGGIKFDITKALRLASPVSIWLTRAVSRIAKLIRGWRHLALLGHWISNVTRGSKKAEEIVLVAVKK